VALRLLVGILASASLVVSARAASFDKPQFTKTVDLGISRSNPPGQRGPGIHAKVTCHFFPRFMVKEVDSGEKGAERLAIVPTDKSKDHTCSRLRDPGEREINSDEWTGYFKGVKGDLVFFDADDGWNGGMGFVVYNAKTMKKIYEDVALGDLTFSDGRGPQTTIAYTRVVDGGCVLPSDSTACWSTIQKKFNLESATAPDCKAGYDRSAEEMAKGRCQAQKADDPQCLAKELSLARTQAADAPSVIVYPVEVVLEPTPAVRPVGGEVRCWPAD
jgi:hypothetical protein